MRIIHTSDWHLGQHFMGKTREVEHRAFLDWLLTLIRESRADALVVAGDIFDTGTPPSYARALYNEFIVSLQKTELGQAIFLGGNHDSAATLNEGRNLLACLKTRVVAGLSEDIMDHVILLRDRDGDPGLLICALPFLRPRDLVNSCGGQGAREKQQALGQAIKEAYDRVYEAALEQRQSADLPIMATGHLTVVGGKSSDAVKDIYIGSLDAFPVSGFPPADYIALGHLHQAQSIKQQDYIRYSGAPIPLSFDETKMEKQVLQIDFNPGKSPVITPVPIPCFRPLVSLHGNLQEIQDRLSELDTSNTEDKTGTTSIWLEAQVLEDDYLSDLTQRIQKMVEETGRSDLELLRVQRKSKTRTSGLIPQGRERLEELSPGEVFERRLEQELLDPETAGALKKMFDRVLIGIQTGVPIESEDREV